MSSQIDRKVYNRRKDPESRNVKIISSRVTSMTFDEQMSVIEEWHTAGSSKYVCVANVHMLMEAHRDPNFNRILQEADLVTADGMPLVFLMRLFGAKFQNRVAGMDIFSRLCSHASENDVGVFFLGSDESTLSLIRRKLRDEYPRISIAGMLCPLVDKLTVAEDQHLVEQINNSGAGLVFVALGCPKQEKWMAAHHGQVKATMVGVGGVFSVYAGIMKYAPVWMRELSLEWLYRLIQEPKRLWRRYLFTIPPFLYLAVLQILDEIILAGVKNLVEKFQKELFGVRFRL